MYTYVNKRTGNEIQTPCECSGGDWERRETAPQTAPQIADKPRAQKKGAKSK